MEQSPSDMKVRNKAWDEGQQERKKERKKEEKNTCSSTKYRLMFLSKGAA
jgi:hypothetical protein